MNFYVLVENLFVREGIRSILKAKYPNSVVNKLRDIDELKYDEIEKDAYFICNNPLVYYNFQPKISNLTVKKGLKTILLANSQQMEQLKSKDIDALNAILYTDCSLSDLNEALEFILLGKKYRCKKLQLQENKENEFTAFLVKHHVSFREIEIINLVIDGLNSKEIAEKLNISYNTVTTHRRNINKKLGLKGPNDLIRLTVIGSKN